MKIIFEVTTRPQSFDLEDDIGNLLQDDGVKWDLEQEVQRILTEWTQRDRYRYKIVARIVADI